MNIAFNTILTIVLKLLLSMSCSGSLLILALLLGKQLWKHKISRQWQYYIWLVAVLRLLIPFGPKVSLLGKAYQAVDQAVTKAAPFLLSQPVLDSPGSSEDDLGSNSPDFSENDLSSTSPDSSGNSFTLNIPGSSGNGLDPNTSASPEYVPEPNSLGYLESTHTSATRTESSKEEKLEFLTPTIWLIWLVVTLGLLLRKITLYQSFLRYIRAGLTPVSGLALLDQLSLSAEQAGVKKPIELCVNPLVSSPLLIGFFHPCIVLPSTEIPEKNFPYIFLHELTHYKRLDMFYKWLVQVTVCLHWFNPLVYFMKREVTKACEFSCDEAVLARIKDGNAWDYGKTLLDAMAAVRNYKETLGAVTLSANKQLLKERLGAIMKFRKKSTPIRFLTGVLTLCLLFGAAFLGIYPVNAATKQTADSPAATKQMAGKLLAAFPDVFQMDTTAVSKTNPATTPTANQDKVGGRKQVTARKRLSQLGTGTNSKKNPSQTGTTTNRKDYAAQAKRYYKAGSIPLFQIAFSHLDEKAQDQWLNTIYTDDDFLFWGAAIGQLEEDCALIQRYAQKTYADGDITYFSTLIMHMSEETLEEWLDQALADGDWAFQSMLSNALDREDDFDKQKEKQEKEWAETQMAEYQAVGVTMGGKNYYYQGQLVNVFLDIRSNQSFYTLNMNPKGMVNIKILRNKKNQVTGVAYMTEEEVTELLEDMSDAEEDEDEDDDDEDDEDDEGDEDDDYDEEYDGNKKNKQKTAPGRVWYPQVTPIQVETMADGEIVWLGEYTLSEGDRIWYSVAAETGNGLQVGFAKPGDLRLNTTYFAVKNLRQEKEALECIASFTVKPPVKPGTYQLFLRATDGALGQVTGNLSIGFVKDALPVK